MRAGWFYSPSQIARYFPSRITSLFNFPRLEFKDPIRILRQLNRHQWNMFAVGFAGKRSQHNRLHGSVANNS